MEKSNIDVKIALDEMRLNLQQSLNAGDIIDQKLNRLLTASGVVLALLSFLNLSLSTSQSRIYWILFFVVVGFYVLLLLITLYAISPQKYRLPLDPDWKELNNSIFEKTEREIILTLLSGYIDQIQNNRKINLRKAKFYNIGLIVLPVTIVILFALLVI